jgi:hypothetical protein
MKAEDLMISDWVKIIHHHTPKPLIKVKKVDLEDFRDALLQVYPEITYEHIPITPEILEKNGFKKDRDYGYFIGQSNSGYFIYFNDNYLLIQAGNDAIEFAWCEYIHEFQHALKLCGIKKEIIL